MNEATHERFRKVLESFDTAVLATVGAQGGIHARPMAIFQVEPDGNLVFITDEESAKVQEIEKDSRATVVCQNGWSSTATLTGHAQLFRDAEKLRAHWRKSFQAWFPDGPDDPRIRLVRVQGEIGEFWDSSGLKGFRYLYQSAKAIVTGSRPQIKEPEQHAKVPLNTPVS